MSARSQTSSLPMLPGLDSDTSSLASGDGATRSDSQEFQTTPTSGQGVARASRSPKRARAAASTTLDIFGPRGLHSSRSAALQSSLESRLRDRMASLGSTMFSLTWRDAVTPAGRRLLVRAASPRRTAGIVCTSWPTPIASRATYSRRNGNPDENLAGAAALAPWPTATASDHKRGIADANRAARNAGGASLSEAAGWATPTVSQAGRNAEQFLERKRKTRACGVALTDLGLQVRSWIPGGIANGSNASTGSVAPSQLNPRFSLWLMGYPIEWASCAAAATRSSRRSRRRS